MNTKRFVKLFALITVFALVFAGCGSKEEAPAAQTEAPAASVPAASIELGLKEFTLESSIWSSANGASVDLTAVPTAYAEGMTASFVVRLEGEDVVNNTCQWDGNAFTSYADLNAEDGYCYYVVLTGPDGAQTTVEINTPTTTCNEALINLAASLESFCNITVGDAPFANGKLTINEGSVAIRVPHLTGGDVTCTSADLILNLDGGALAKKELELTEADSMEASYVVDLAGVSFDIPEMEGDHQLTLILTAYLSDGTTLTDGDSTAWFYSDGNVHLTVG